MINWESTRTPAELERITQIANAAADRYELGAPPDKCNIPTMPLWAPVEPLEGCECLACQNRRKQPPEPGNDPPVAPPELFTGLRNGLIIMAAVLGIVYLAFKLGGWQ